MTEQKKSKKEMQKKSKKIFKFKTIKRKSKQNEYIEFFAILPRLRNNITPRIKNFTQAAVINIKNFYFHQICKKKNK